MTGVNLRRPPAASVEIVKDTLGHPVRLGHGGNRGSCVYLVRCNGLTRALKACGLNPSEAVFCAATQALLHAKSTSPTVPSPRDPAEDSYPPSGHDVAYQAGVPSVHPVRGLDALALPIYVVDQHSFIDRASMAAVTPAALLGRLADPCTPDDLVLGIIMPTYDCSLQRLLTAASVESACRPQSTPVVPSSPGSRGSWESLDGCGSSMDDAHRGGGGMLDESSSDSDDARSPLHTTARQRQVKSLVVIAAVLEQVVRGLACLHTALAHTRCPSSGATSAKSPLSASQHQRGSSLPDDAPNGLAATEAGVICSRCQEDECRPQCNGFAHQDVRSDNILVARSGQVVLCDFELVAHFDEAHETLHQSVCDGSLTDAETPTSQWSRSCFETSARRRLLPPAYHAPEGPYSPKGDSWLVGLLALELFTGVAPLVRASVAQDDFGDGPTLTVDPHSGIGWPFIRRHVDTKIRPFPSTEAATTGRAAGYMDPFIAHYCADNGLDAFETLHRVSAAFEDFCSRCLANSPRDRWTPAELLEHKLFEEIRTMTNSKPQLVVRRWMRTIGASAAGTPLKVAEGSP